MGRERARDPDSIAGIAGFALGMSYALAFTALWKPAEPSRTVAWISVAVVTAAALVVALQAKLRRNPMVVIAAGGFLPVAVTSTIAQSVGRETDAGRAISGVGVIIAFAATYGAAIWFAGRKRELDRQVFTQAAVVAFFVTVGTGVVYGVAQTYMDAPDLPTIWLALLGLTVFNIALAFFERRYA
jgi:hypothetical protein